MQRQKENRELMEAVRETIGRGKGSRRVWRIGPLGLAGVVMMASCAAPPPPPLVSVSVRTAPLGSAIPPGFVGMSLEVSTLGQGLPVPSKGQQLASEIHPQGEFVYALGKPGDPNQGYFQLMRNLGHATLRLGGNSQDNTCWDKSAAPHPKLCGAAIGPGKMKLWSEAARATGWRLILGINLKQNSPAWALGEVTRGVARSMKPSEVEALEIGNEPSQFRGKGRPKNYSVQDYLHDYLGYAKAFAANPVAKQYALAGPTACCAWENTKDLTAFMDALRHSNLKLVTVHEYVTSVCHGPNVTIAQLLEPETTERFIRRARRWVAAAQERGLPIALAETNSTSCGGMTGVSNAFASAVWGLDYMFQAAQAGFSSINFHTSYKTGGSAYNPIVTTGIQNASGHWSYTNIAQPLYYAMYLFARKAEGKRFLSTTVKTTANVPAYAVSSCPSCAVRVFLINKDLKASGRAQVRVVGRHSPATLLVLRAPTLSSTATAVRYGGQPFSSGGQIGAPQTETVTANSRGEYVFNLPNASAALLTVAAK